MSYPKDDEIRWEVLKEVDYIIDRFRHDLVCGIGNEYYSGSDGEFDCRARHTNATEAANP